MQATIRDINEFKKLLDTIGAFDPTFNIKCSKNGFHISSLDTAKTSVVNATLTVDYFESYKYTAGPDEIELGVKVDTLVNVFKSAGKKASFCARIGVLCIGSIMAKHKQQFQPPVCTTVSARRWYMHKVANCQLQ